MGRSRRQDAGLLVLRAGTGGVLFAHGAQIVFGWFGGPGLAASSVGMERMGFRPGRPSALVAGGGQVVSGTLLAAGLATPVAGAVAAGAMAGAAAVHAPAGFFALSGGYEFPAFLGWAAAALGVSGPGRYSADHLTGHRLNRPRLAALAFLGTTAATCAVLRRRAAVLQRRDQRQDQDQDQGQDRHPHQHPHQDEGQTP
ncbi:DoxX family protein [Streptomyces xiamenensis]|uniref:DoxX family protein n=1 Tax=Streptomyces xiamenensis TaxID=408015 RepID=UPI00341986EB